MRITYLFVYYLMIFLLALSTAGIIIAAHPKTLPYLAQKLLNDNGVSYSHINGSLLDGIILHDIKYHEAVSISRLELKYNLFMLLRPRPKFTRLILSDALIVPDKFQHDKASPDGFEIPTFSLSELILENTRLFIDDESLKLDLLASQLDYQEMLDVNKIDLVLTTSYGDLKAQGHINSNKLYTKGSLAPKEHLIEEYLSSFEMIKKTLDIEIEADADKILLQTHLSEIKPKDHNASLSNADITLNYLSNTNHFDLKARYQLAYEGFRAMIMHHGIFSTAGDFKTDMNATVTDSPLALPFDKFRATASGDAKSMRGHLTAGALQFKLTTSNYEQFHIHTTSKGLSLSFIPSLPELFSKNSIVIDTDANLQVAPFSLKGVFDAEGLYNVYKGGFEISTDAFSLSNTLTPKPKSKLWAEYPIEQFSPVNILYYKDNEQNILGLNAKRFNLTLFKSGAYLNGWGNLGSGYFDTNGKITDMNTTRLTLRATIPSVHKLMSELGYQTPDEKVLFDAKAGIDATIELSDDINVKSRIHLPWYTFQADTQNSYQGENLYLESTLIDEKLTVDRYNLDIKGYKIYSQRPSQITFDTNGSLILDEFWVYDNLLVSGKIDPSQRQGELHLKSNRFNYDSKEGNITLKADITASLKNNAEQHIEGEITLLDGTITYEPKTDYTLSDDVLIIQDIKPLNNVKRFVNIRINSLRPIRYKTKEINLRFTPNVILWQDSGTPLGIYGIVTIDEGQVISGTRVFDFDKSEIYFNGANPVNPYLNLNMQYQTVDKIDIQIYITDKMSAPVIILTSTPPMSQNDIMSYILFDEPASSAFGSSTEGSKTLSLSSLMLATGLKQIFNDTTNVKIDTLNILTNKEGTLGYEIGTRFNKNIRVLYKNDTVSSVIVQYSLNRSIRLDVDVHETGQGISILYVKDF